MPEGHVIHRLAAGLNDTFAGRSVRVTSPQGRFLEEAGRLDGSVLVAGEALGKHLFIEFDAPQPRWIHVHLGLIGKFWFGPAGSEQGQVRLLISDGETSAHLHGPQWCRAVTSEQKEAVVAASGPDPLRADADPGRGYARLHRSGKPLAALLMDQRVTAGVGNIFRAEVLFRHRLDPTTPGREVGSGTWEVIWADLVGLMGLGVQRGRIDTVRDEHGPQAQGRPARVDRHGGEVYVYRRAGMPCLVCGTPVRVHLLEGRNLYWCPRCQRRKRA